MEPTERPAPNVDHPPASDTVTRHSRQVTVLSVAPSPLYHASLVDFGLEDLVTQGGGWVAPGSGTALTAVWGLDVPGEDDAVQAVRAALAMREALAGANKTGALAPEAGMGMHTGPVRIPGTGEEAVAGDAVERAADLGRAAPPGGLLISADTYRLVRGLFEMKPLPEAEVPGRRTTSQTYLVLRAKVRAFQYVQRGLTDRESPFVGRQTELNSLRETFEAVVRTGVRGAVTVCGEPGIGKSRLLREFEDWSDLHPARCWLFRGRCEPPFEHSPWALVRDILALRFSIPENLPGEETVKALQEGMAHLWTPDKAAEAAPWVAALVGWNPGHGLTANSQILRDRALGYLEDWWADLALRHSLLIVLEDLHWADEASLGALEAVFDRIRDRPFLVLSTTRPGLWERTPGWGAGRGWHRRVDLPPLSAAETGALVSSLVQGEGRSSTTLVDSLADRAGGNPFFAEELVHAWREAQDGDLGVLRLPVTLGAVLEGRLSRLSPGARRLIGQAAVVGQTFWDAAVDAMEGCPWPGEPWAELIRADLVYRRGTSLVSGATEWQFRHSLIRQAVLDSGATDQHRTWSRAAAVWLTGLDLADGPARAAPHWEVAGETQMAADAWGQALAAARSTRAPEPAIRAADGALRLGTWTRQEAFDLGLERCRALEEASLFDRLKRELDALETEARALGGEAFGAWFLEVAAFASVFSEFSRIDSLWTSPEMEQVPVSTKTRLLDRYIKALTVNRRLREAGPLVTQYEELVLTAPWFQAKRDSTLGLYKNIRGGAAHDGIELSLSSARRFLVLGDDYQAMLTYINVLTFLPPRIARDEVWPTLEGLHLRVREPYLWGIGLFNYGMLSFRHGYLDLGLEKVTQSLRYEPPLDTGRCETLTFLALHGWLAGNLDQATGHRRDLREFSVSTGNLRGVGLADELDGIAAVEAGNFAEAGCLLARAKQALLAQGEAVNALLAEAWEALALAGGGKAEQAQRLAEQAAGKVLALEAFSELSFPSMIHSPLAQVLKVANPPLAKALVLRALEAMKTVSEHIGDAGAEADYWAFSFHRNLVALAGDLGLPRV